MILDIFKHFLEKKNVVVDIFFILPSLRAEVWGTYNTTSESISKTKLMIKIFNGSNMV